MYVQFCIFTGNLNTTFWLNNDQRLTDKCAIVTVSDEIVRWNAADCGEEHAVVCQAGIDGNFYSLLVCHEDSCKSHNYKIPFNLKYISTDATSVEHVMLPATSTTTISKKAEVIVSTSSQDSFGTVWQFYFIHYIHTNINLET